jgi:hypothetical protein
MSKTFVVRLRGASYQNEDGTDRQEFISQCKPGSALILRAEPLNPHDRHAVAVLNQQGQQLGYLPSDARDASAISRGEGISARVEKRIGGPKWWHRVFGTKRHYGLLIRLTKEQIDWEAHNNYREDAEPVDHLVRDALAFEKQAPSLDDAIDRYVTALEAVIQLNVANPTAAAHRYTQAPINRLTMLLVRNKRFGEAIKHYESWVASNDPLGLSKADRNALEKRIAKLSTSQ